MNDSQKEQQALKAYRLSQMTELDWKNVMPKYWQQLSEWWIIPNFFWWLLIIAGIIMVGFSWYYPWLPVTASLISLYSAVQIGSRTGNIVGFQTGYEWGKIDGVCKGLGINETEQDKQLQKARDLIVEFKVESGDPSLEIGENYRNNI